MKYNSEFIVIGNLVKNFNCAKCVVESAIKSCGIEKVKTGVYRRSDIYEKIMDIRKYIRDYYNDKLITDADKSEECMDESDSAKYIRLTDVAMLIGWNPEYTRRKLNSYGIEGVCFGSIGNWWYRRSDINSVFNDSMNRKWSRDTSDVPEGYYSISDFAKIAEISRSTIERNISTGVYTDIIRSKGMIFISVKEVAKEHFIQRRPEPPEGFVLRAVFEEEHSIPQYFITNMLRRGKLRKSEVERHGSYMFLSQTACMRIIEEFTK